MLGLRPRYNMTVNTSIFTGIAASLFGLVNGARNFALIMIACSVIGLLERT